MLLTACIVLLFLLYVYVQSSFKYWKNRNVPYPKPSLLLGNIGPSLSLKKSIGQIYAEIYNAFPDYLYVGYYKVRKPAIIVRDPQLIRDVLVKEFNSFHDNEVEIDERVDPLAARNAFTLKGQQWKTIKTHITPCFTPRKLKEMFVFVEDAAKKLIDYIDKTPEASTADGVESRELFAKFATEVVASCAFGLEGNVFSDPDSLFRKMGKKIFEPDVQTIIKSYILVFAPSLSKFFKVGFISKPVCDYFISIVKATLKHRKDNDVTRNDFMDFMINLKNKSMDYEFTDIDITAQAVGFFFDGFETSSAMLSYTFHELATNREVLQKLQREIDDAFADNNGKPDFDTIIGLQYLDAVIHESLRMHPPLYFLMRMCTKPFKFPPPQGVDTGPELEVEVGTPIVVSTYGLHHDPQFFKDPSVFNPDRFLPENKEAIVKGSYLPFGDGGRSCHGQRFALMQIKTVMAHVLHNYDVRVGTKTILPLDVDPKYIVPHPTGGLWVKFIKRK